MSGAVKPQTQKTSEVVQLLRHELARRLEKNPQYSQRSFARSLGMSHTLLSLVLNGHRKPSRKMIQKLVERLQLPPTQTSRLTGKPQEKFTLDQFALISEWQHFAILSLLEVPDTEFTPEFIAGRLGISRLLAKISIKRLVELGIVEQDPETGRWRQRSGPIVVENTVSTQATRRFQRQLLEKATESLENDPIELRDFSSVTFAMDPTHVEYALKKIRKFRRGLMEELESFGNPKEVYNLTVQIFPTSRRSKA